MITRSFCDQLGNQLFLPFAPQRIVSLVPSQTELLYDLGLNREVIGITKFCIYPPQWQHEKQIVGGTKDFQEDVIEKINPDIIIGNKEENDKARIELLQKKYPVWMSDINSLNDAKEMIREIGRIVNKITEADDILENINASFRLIRKKVCARVLYLIWRKPWMAAGSGTFINAMLEEVGFENCLAGKSRYPELTAGDIKDMKPDIILLSSEPYPFQEKHRDELNLIIPSSRIILVDGEMFSWYGSRLIRMPEYFNSIAF